MTEEKIDKKLGISTCGRFDKSEDDNHRAYEPTPYTVLDRLADSEYFENCRYLIDYGAGKSRVGCYLSTKIKGLKTIGVEFDDTMVSESKDNLKNINGNVDISYCDAENFEFPREADSAYFFNPFSEIILRSVLGKVVESWYDNPRPIRMFFYYPSMEYVGFLMCHERLSFVDEIDCSDLFPNKDAREVIMVFDVE